VKSSIAGAKPSLPMARADPRWPAWLQSQRGGLLAAILVFTALSMVYFGGALTDPVHRCACWAGVDPETYMWFLSWWPHAILHGHNPFETTSLFAPDHVNLGALILLPGAATVLAPITLLFGPLVSYNLLVVAEPIVAATFAFMLCRYLTGRVLPSLAGGYVFGFSPYVLGHMMGHPDLLMIFPLPAIVHVALRRFDGRISHRRATVYLVLLLGWLYVSSPELTLTFVLVGALTLALGFGLAGERRSDVIEVVRVIAMAGGITIVLLSVFIYYALTGEVTTPFFNGFPDYGADGLGWVIPTAIVRLGRAWFRHVSGQFVGGISENGVYVGVPLALIVARYGITRWNAVTTRILLIILGVLIVLATGAHLHIAGLITLPMPWGWIRHLPLLSRAIPLRLGAYVFLIVALMLALWLAQPRSGAWQRGKWAVALIGLALLFPNLGQGWWSSRPPNPSFFTSETYRHYLTRDETALVLPWGTRSDEMLWQAETGFWYRQTGAYLGALLPLDYQRDPLLAPFNGSNVPPSASEVRGFLTGRHVGAVIVDASDQGYWTKLLTEVGLRGTTVGGVIVYPVAG
jgi:hypothetical protein